MAMINRTSSSRQSSGLVCGKLSFAAKEAFKRLRANVIAELPENGGGCHTFGVTSALPAEGKSTVVVNLAYALSAAEHKVLVIDGDLRRPSVHSKLELELSPGLTDLLSDSNKISASTRKYTSSDGICFDVIPAGQQPDTPTELLTSARMKKLLAAVSTVYDYILIDLPPVGAVIDAVSVGKNTEGVLVVVREQKCPTQALDDCIDQLMHAGIRILGFTVNGSQGARKGYYSKYNKYKYGYGNYYGRYGYYNGYYDHSYEHHSKHRDD